MHGVLANISACMDDGRLEVSSPVACGPHATHHTQVYFCCIYIIYNYIGVLVYADHDHQNIMPWQFAVLVVYVLAAPILSG